MAEKKKRISQEAFNKIKNHHKFKKTMQEFAQRQLFSSSGDLVTDHSQAIAISISKAKQAIKGK